MVAAFAWFWLWYLDLPESTLVVIAGALIALPLALQESAGDAARGAHGRGHEAQPHPGPVGAGDLRLRLPGQGGVVLWTGGGMCRPAPRLGDVAGVGRPPGADRIRAAPPPASPGAAGPPAGRASTSGCAAALLGGVLAAGGTHYARIGFSLNAAQFNVVIAAFAAGLVLLAALAVVPRRRVYLATNVVVALLSGFLALQLVRSPSRPPMRSCSTRH